MQDNLLEKDLKNAFQRRVHNLNEAKTLDFYAVDISKLNLLSESEEKKLGKKINRTLSHLLLVTAKNADLLNELEDLIFRHFFSTDVAQQHPAIDAKAIQVLENLLVTLFDTYRVKIEVGEIADNAHENLIHNIVFLLLGIGFSRYKIVELLDKINTDTCPKELETDMIKVKQKYILYRNRLVESNLRLVFLAAKKVRAKNTPLEEIIQFGNLGLIKAAERFDFNRGYRFSTYAFWCIHNSIKLALQKTSHLISRPPYLQTQQGLVEQTKQVFKKEHGRNASANELAKRTGLTSLSIENILQLPLNPISLSTPVNETGDVTLEETLCDENNSIRRYQLKKYRSQSLSQLFQHITAREKLILEMRYGIGFHKEYTLHEIGTQMGLSFERVRQLQKQALEKLASYDK